MKLRSNRFKTTYKYAITKDGITTIEKFNVMIDYKYYINLYKSQGYKSIHFKYLGCDTFERL